MPASGNRVTSLFMPIALVSILDEKQEPFRIGMIEHLNVMCDSLTTNLMLLNIIVFKIGIKEYNNNCII